jgi:hypothetical protein
VSGFELTPAAVDVEAGALNRKGYELYWDNGYFHRWPVGTEGDLDRDLHCFLPFSRRAVLKPLRGLYLKPKSFEIGEVLNCLACLIEVRHTENDGLVLPCAAFSGSRNYEPTQDGHYRGKRLGILFQIEAGLLKAFPNLVARHTVGILHQQIMDGFRQRRKFSFRVCHFAQKTLTVGLFRHEPCQGSEKDPEFSDSSVKSLSIRHGLLELCTGILDELVCLHRHNGAYYHG